jgi:hypothetical protein
VSLATKPSEWGRASWFVMGQGAERFTPHRIGIDVIEVIRTRLDRSDPHLLPTLPS